uniref:Ig-like domain-containing protein n=1 Tax=Gadus morhua TaxID=8049 RepID=A0A8C5C9R6_GADMO
KDSHCPLEDLLLTYKLVSPSEYYLWTYTPVGCVFGGICVLPCRFQTNSDKIIHWIKISGGTLQVHSYYDDEDQLGHQDPLYKGRTSLFYDQISGGNGSLVLARVNLQDQGRYQCYASTTHYNQETFVTLTVVLSRPPVTKVDIVLGNNTVTCQSRGIYPRPQLTWSVSNHPATVLQNTTEVHEDDQGLYDISVLLQMCAVKIYCGLKHLIHGLIVRPLTLLVRDLHSLLVKLGKIVSWSNFSADFIAI